MDLKLVRRARGVSVFWMILASAVAVVILVAIVIITTAGTEEGERPAAVIGQEEKPGAASFTEGESADGPTEEGELPQDGPIGTEAVEPAVDPAAEQGGEEEEGEDPPAGPADDSEATPPRAAEPEGDTVGAVPAEGEAAQEVLEQEAAGGEGGSADQQEEVIDAPAVQSEGESPDALVGDREGPSTAEGSADVGMDEDAGAGGAGDVVIDRQEPDSEEQSPTPEDEQDKPGFETTPSGPEGRDQETILQEPGEFE